MPVVERSWMTALSPLPDRTAPSVSRRRAAVRRLRASCRSSRATACMDRLPWPSRYGGTVKERLKLHPLRVRNEPPVGINAMRPELSNPDARRAYRRELRGVYRVPRILAVALLAAGGIGLLIDNWRGSGSVSLIWLSWAAVGAGATSCIILVVLRTRYHGRRMSE